MLSGRTPGKQLESVARQEVERVLIGPSMFHFRRLDHKEKWFDVCSDSSSVVASLTILAAVWPASSWYAVSLFIATVRIGSPTDFCFDTSNFSISALCPSGDTLTTLYTPTNPSGTTS